MRGGGIRGDVGIAPYGMTIDRQCVGADDLAVEQSGTSTWGARRRRYAPI